ncbi:MAG TPA: calcium-binding protein [Nocardioidaceae bacterium]|nr:calcium-binding protein [Nocardioidaceae bacterium]
MYIKTSLRRCAVVAGGSAGALALVASAAVGMSSDPITGTNHRDDLKGTSGADLIYAYGGNDWVVGRAGADEVHGNGGQDYLGGGKNQDVVIGGPGPDSLAPAGGADRVYGGRGKDTVYLTKDHRVDQVNCGTGRDKVWGATKRDDISANCEHVTSNTPSCRILPIRLIGQYATEARC